MDRLSPQVWDIYIDRGDEIILCYAFDRSPQISKF